MDDLTFIGRIQYLQIQRERLIRDVRPDRTYHIEPLVEVGALVLSPEGPLAKIDGGWVVAVHHSAHPANPMPNRERMVSVGFTSHYVAMADRFGDAPVGVAGENIIVATDRVIGPAEVAPGIVIERPDGRHIELKGPAVAEPCVPFTRFMMKDPAADLDFVAPHREFLRNGMRGYVMGTAGLSESVEIGRGDRVFVR